MIRVDRLATGLMALCVFACEPRSPAPAAAPPSDAARDRGAVTPASEQPAAATGTTGGSDEEWERF